MGVRNREKYRILSIRVLLRTQIHDVYCQEIEHQVWSKSNLSFSTNYSQDSTNSWSNHGTALAHINSQTLSPRRFCPVDNSVRDSNLKIRLDPPNDQHEH